MRWHCLRLAALSISLAALSCAGGAAHEEELHDEAEISQRAARMRSSPEYDRLREAFWGCLERLGYEEVGSSQGAILKDGSRFPRGQGFTANGAILDYLIDRERCENETGFADLVAEYGLDSRPPDPDRARASNQQKVTQMNCLAAKGYSIPEPKTLRGYLIFDFAPRTTEEEVAFQHDLIDCNREIWGSNFPPAY